jgi:ATP-binding cassette subfamily B protein
MHTGDTVKRLGVYARLLGYLKRHWKEVLLGYSAMLAVTLLNLYVPQIIKYAIDRGLTDTGSGETLIFVPAFIQQLLDRGVARGGAAPLYVAGGIILVIAIIRGLAGFAERYYGLWLTHRFSYDIRNEFYSRMQTLPFSFHDRTQTGDIMSRVTSDITETERFVGIGMMDLLSSVLLLVGVIVAMLLEDTRLALLALVPMPVLIAATIRFGNTVRPRFKEIQEQMGTLATSMQESLTGIRVVKAFAREPYELAKFDKENEEWFRRRFGLIQIWANNWPFFTFLIALSIFLLLWFGGPSALNGDITVGTLFAMVSYVLMLNGPVQRLGFLVNLAASAAGSATRAFEIIDAHDEIEDKEGAAVLDDIQGDVRFKNVSFSYSSGQEVLRDVSFHARPGQTTALIGPTGSGKSTLINLIPRFYDVSSGHVLVDDIDVRDVTQQSLRHQIGIVLQDSFLFSSTIAENIAYGSPGAPREAIVEAAKAARAHEFISGFPEGYDTRVGERGVTLSGGQKQRVAIARALLTDPRILILDDSLSNVDTETEHLIQQALTVLMEGRTTFIIAQRLVTLKNADRILVLDGGRIVQRGTHEALLADGGLYEQIYDLQLRDQEEFKELEQQMAVKRSR